MARMFAVSESKGWVELRGGKSPPRCKVTRASKVVERYHPPRYTTREVNGRIVFGVEDGKTVREKQTIIHTTWVGGRTLGVLPQRRFASLFKVNLQKGGCTELLPAQVAEVRHLLKKEKERGKPDKTKTPAEAPVVGRNEATGPANPEAGGAT